MCHSASSSFLAYVWNQCLIPHLVASEHRWLVKAPRWIHSVPDVSGRRSWHCGCHARLWNPRRHKRVPFVNIAFLCSRLIKRRQWKHKLDYYVAVFAHLATGCGIKAKDPSGLDSDWWIPHSRCCENPAQAKALPGFSRHLSAGFTDLNPAPQGISLYNPWTTGLLFSSKFDCDIFWCCFLYM